MDCGTTGFPELGWHTRTKGQAERRPAAGFRVIAAEVQAVIPWEFLPAAAHMKDEVRRDRSSTLTLRIDAPTAVFGAAPSP